MGQGDDTENGGGEALGAPEAATGTAPPPSRVRRVAMRSRRVVVLGHRWLAFALMAWLVVITLTGAWLVSSHAIDSWFHGDRYEATDGDVGPVKAFEAGKAAFPEDAHVYGMTLPRNGRGVYHVYAEFTTPGADPDLESSYEYKQAYVDPGSGKVNATASDEEGLTWTLYRGHMYLWQDHGIFGVFDPETGWCRTNAKGVEPGGVKGVICDVIPDGMDMVAWFGVGWIVVLLTGFYLWYWPGVRRWATALVVKRGRGRFTFNMTLHKAVGIVVWVPLLVITFTGIAFAFPNLKGWYENVTPAERGKELWVAPEKANTSGKANGREAIGLDGFLAMLETKFPDRIINYIEPPGDKKGVYGAWMSRGFDPWTREGGAGNVWVTANQYTGAVLYDGTPEDGNVFDQLWSDWSFPLHTGDWGGMPTRWLWIIVALTPLVLGTTGIIMYFTRRSKRKRRPNGENGDDADSAEPPLADVDA